VIAGTFGEKNQCQGGAQTKMENYIGPYWSDGKWQESVEFGETPALSAVDEASRLHDSAYAHFTDEAHRVAADEIYSATLKRIREPNAALADVPLYGNYIKNRAEEIGSDVLGGFRYGGLAGAFGGLLYNGIKGIVRSNDLIQHGDEYREDVLKYYATDPYIPKETRNEKKQIVVSIPKPIAPLQTQTLENDEMFKRNTVKPDEPRATSQPPAGSVRTRFGKPPALNQVSTVEQLYRPLRKKERKPVTAADLKLYLKYNPKEALRVENWLAKNIPQ